MDLQIIFDLPDFLFVDFLNFADVLSDTIWMICEGKQELFFLIQMSEESCNKIIL